MADEIKPTIPRAKCLVCGEWFAVGARHEKVMADLSQKRMVDVNADGLCAFCYRLYQSARREGAEIAEELKPFKGD